MLIQFCQILNASINMHIVIPTLTLPIFNIFEVDLASLIYKFHIVERMLVVTNFIGPSIIKYLPMKEKREKESTEMQFAIQSSNKFLVNYTTFDAYSTTAIHALWKYYIIKSDFKTNFISFLLRQLSTPFHMLYLL